MQWTIWRWDSFSKSLYMVRNILVPQKERCVFTDWVAITLSILSYLHFIVIKYTHSTTYGVVTIRNLQCKSNFGQIGIGHTNEHTYCMYMHGSQLKFKLQHSAPSSAATKTPPHAACVVMLVLWRTVLSECWYTIRLQEIKFRDTFQKISFFKFFEIQ
jgi:hypothetical protein